jgi:hypothetical protein
MRVLVGVHLLGVDGRACIFGEKGLSMDATGPAVVLRPSEEGYSEKILPFSSREFRYPGRS